MLFRKKIEPSCSYCKRGTTIDEETIICIKRGISAPWESCKKFVYDPLKRVPAAPQRLLTRGIKEEDFAL
ncbi:MAG: hypothetical protein GX254_08815 [Clostridiales bacterium]|jgi:hypothetical protein|nr:hypothetical protein [Clostridiales bacterium]